MVPGFHFGAEPRALAFGKLACGDCGLLAGGFKIDLAAQVRNQLWRPNGFGRQMCWIVGGKVRLGFFQRA